MTTFDTRSKDVIVGNIAAGMQSRYSLGFLNFAKGKVFRVLAEAVAGVGLWLQKEVLKTAALTRAATSDADDLDSWVGDYGLTRLPARSATGLVTFARYTAAPTQAIIPVGAMVQTGDGSQRFTVYADPTNGAYSSTLGGYVLLAGASAVVVPVSAATPGTVANVSASAISLLASSVAGIDTVLNPAALTNGLDAESDPDLRARFVAYINSLASATPAALAYAIQSLQQGLRPNLREFENPDGTPNFQFNTMWVDDGSGNPPAALIALAATAVNNTRAAGVRVGTFGASTLSASVQMTIQVDAGYYAPDVVAAVVAALSVYINGLGLGAKLRYTRLEQIAYDTSPGVTNVTAVTLNGGTLDLAPTPGQTIKIGLGGLVVSAAS
jgi:uncharacterized phage protein gp47/JayE